MFIAASAGAQGRTGGPELLRYSDLVALYENEEPSQDLQKKLTELLMTPFLNNSINSSDAKPGRSATNAADDSLRVAIWNIEGGLEFDAIKAALTNDQVGATRFEWLTLDRMVQRVQFADDVTLTANFTDHPFAEVPPRCIKVAWLKNGGTERFCPEP